MQTFCGLPWSWPNNKTTPISAHLMYLIWVMYKVLASHMLQGNFATEKVTSLKNEAHLIEPSTFSPQKNACLVKRERSTEVKATSEYIMDFTDYHKTKGKTLISCINMMTAMVNISSLCINMNTIITTTCSSNVLQPILCQILLNFVSIVNNPDWVHW
jgi:hypothetical protein